MTEARAGITQTTVTKNMTGIEEGSEADIVSKLVFSSADPSGEATFMSTVEALMDIDSDVAKQYFNEPSPAVTRGMPTAVKEQLARIRDHSKRYENVRLRSKQERAALMAQKPNQMASPYSPDAPVRPDLELVDLVRNSLKKYRKQQREIV